MFKHLKSLLGRTKPDAMQKINADAHELGAAAPSAGCESPANASQRRATSTAEAWASACAAFHERDAVQDPEVVRPTLLAPVLVATALGIALGATPAVWMDLMALSVALWLTTPALISALLFGTRATVVAVAAIALASRYIWVGIAHAHAKRVRGRCEVDFAE